jgi:large subunit ribosomal protein L32
MGVDRSSASGQNRLECLFVTKSGNYTTVMAAPKKKTSKSRKNMRKATWKRKAATAAQKALSLGKSVLTGRSNSFVYPGNEEEEEE